MTTSGPEPQPPSGALQTIHMVFAAIAAIVIAVCNGA